MIYAVSSATWIALSDGWVASLVTDPVHLTQAQTLKGWFFVSASSVLIFLLVRMAAHVSQARMRLGSRLRIVLDTIPGRVYWTDRDLRLMGGNAAFAREVGIPDPEDLVGRDPATLPWCPPILRGERVPERAVLRAGEPQPRRLELATGPDSDERWDEVVRVPLRDDEDEVAGVLVSMVDVTARKSAEEQLIHAQKIQAIGEVTSGVAHDFKNALSVILANVELLREGGLAEPEAAAALDDVRGAALGASGVVQNLLTLGRRSRVKPRATPLGSLVRGLAPTYSRLLASSYRFEVEVEPGLPDAAADPVAVEHALLNLVTNARDAMPDGGVVRLTVRRAVGFEPASRGEGTRCVPADPEPGRYILVSVADFGVGIAPDRLDDVLKPFYTTKPAGRGTGLGLPMVCTLMQEHCGAFQITSERGRGTTVQLFFREIVPGATQLEEAAPAPRRGSSPATGETILVVDDQADLRRTLTRVLGRQGYHVLSAADGSEALEILNRAADEIDLVLTDMAMPGMGGVELIRAAAGRFAVPFVLTTGLAGEDRVDEIPSEVAHLPLIPKPWTIPELLEGVRLALDSSDSPTSQFPQT
jgi:PAS domain S-box-containing protein